MTDYITLAELKAARKITDTADDAALTSAITAASRIIDELCSLAPGAFSLDAVTSTRTYKTQGRTYYDQDGEWILIDPVGSATGLVVETGRGSTWTAVTNYETGPENAIARSEPITKLLAPLSSWSTGAGIRVRVTAKFGYPVLPDPIKQATLILANRLYKRKESPEGVLGSAEWGVTRISRVDPDVEMLISPYVAPGFA